MFKKHGDKINDITRDSAICIDFDQKIDVFHEPLDVLKYKDITIKFHLIDNLNKAKATFSNC
jgi:Cu/Ag efflux protein CusF